MKTDMLYFCEYTPSPVGKIAIASDGQAIVGLWLEGQKHFMHKISGDLQRNDDFPVFLACKSWLDRYFAGEDPGGMPLPLKPKGTEFQKKVWQALLAIPYGQTVTYGDIARTVGCGSAQAVGGAVGKNPISILIPCHRVVGKDGSITGYSGGVERKEYLLHLEGCICPRKTAERKLLWITST